MDFPSISKSSQAGRIHSHSSPTGRGFETPEDDLWDHNGTDVSLGNRQNSVPEFPERRWNLRNFPLGKSSLETRAAWRTWTSLGAGPTHYPRHFRVPAFCAKETLWLILSFLALPRL